MSFESEVRFFWKHASAVRLGVGDVAEALDELDVLLLHTEHPGLKFRINELRGATYANTGSRPGRIGGVGAS